MYIVASVEIRVSDLTNPNCTTYTGQCYTAPHRTAPRIALNRSVPNRTARLVVLSYKFAKGTVRVRYGCGTVFKFFMADTVVLDR